MTLQQLKYVVEVAERGSITEAAKALFIAQPSLSAAVRELEEEAGITIFCATAGAFCSRRRARSFGLRASGRAAGRADRG